MKNHLLDSAACGRTIVLGLTMALMVLGRPFSHWHVNILGVPLFITEMCLALLMAMVVVDVLQKRVELNLLKSPPLRYWALWISWAAIGFFRGLSVHPVFALRKFALVYYSLFILPILMWHTESGHIRRLLFAMYMAGIATTVIRFFNMMGIQPLIQFGNPSVAMDMAIEFALCYEIYLFVNDNYGWLNMALILLQLYLIVCGNVRTSWISTLLGCAFFLTLMIKHFNRPRSIFLSFLMPFAFGSFLLLHTWLLSPSSALEFAGVNPTVTSKVKIIPSTTPKSGTASVVAKEPAVENSHLTQLAFNLRGIGQSFIPRNDYSYYKQGNANWRRHVWREMATEVLRNHPWIGMGFGVPFLPRIWMSEHETYTEQYPLPNVDPHNSHLSILYRTGLIGLGLYLTFFMLLIRRALHTVANYALSIAQRQTALICVSYVILCLIHTFFAVVLEGSYMGVPFWITVGLTLAASCEGVYADRD